MKKTNLSLPLDPHTTTMPTNEQLKKEEPVANLNFLGVANTADDDCL